MLTQEGMKRRPGERSWTETDRQLASVRRRAYLAEHPAKSGPEATNWKGARICEDYLRFLVRRLLPRPEDGMCTSRQFVICRNKATEVASRSGRKLRLLADWQWVCASCNRMKAKDRRVSQ